MCAIVLSSDFVIDLDMEIRWLCGRRNAEGVLDCSIVENLEPEVCLSGAYLTLLPKIEKVRRSINVEQVWKRIQVIQLWKNSAVTAAL